MSILNKLKKMVGSPAEKAKSEPIKETAISQTPVLKIPIEWVEIPAGTFKMGSPKGEVDREKDEVQHNVTISSFKMSKFPITFEQYDAYCEALGNQKLSFELKLDMVVEGKRPVTYVGWDDATEFAEWMDCRLPTEAEWEYACRAGTTTPFNTGNNITTSQANYDGAAPYGKNKEGEYRHRTVPVDSFSPNAWGLYDMHGNVSEWCSDFYGEYPTTPQINPKGPEAGSYRVIRGGNWRSSARFCRSACRGNLGIHDVSGDLGFRLVYQT